MAVYQGGKKKRLQEGKRTRLHAPPDPGNKKRSTAKNDTDQSEKKGTRRKAGRLRERSPEDC